MPDDIKQSSNGKSVADLSIQRRIEEKKIPESYGGITSSWWFVTDAVAEIAEWWSEQRDRDLRDFILRPGNDILQGANSSIIKKFKAMPWVIEGPNRVVNRYQELLSEAEFGKGWGFLLSKVLYDYNTQDKGAFIELIGQGQPDKAIRGPIMGLAHLDAAQCQLTGDPIYPVLFRNPKDKKPHRIHATRIIHLVDMPSPNEVMLNVGFCAVSRVIASSQVLLKLARYKNEKLDDMPEAGLLVLNNILPSQWDDAKAFHKQERRKIGQEIWSNIMTLLSLDPSQPASATLTSFANLPDAFNELETTTIYVNIVALAFGVDAREFWPVSGGPLGTARESEIQHQKAKGKGVGDLIATIERAINWYVLPPSVSFRFDFQDDEEDMLKAEIADKRTSTIMNMWKPDSMKDGIEPPVSALEIRQMLADQVPYFKEDFLQVDVTEESEVSDTEREEKYGPLVCLDHKGRRRITSRAKPISRGALPSLV